MVERLRPFWFARVIIHALADQINPYCNANSQNERDSLRVSDEFFVRSLGCKRVQVPGKIVTLLGGRGLQASLFGR